jgi:hypothetical protein
VTVAQDTRYRLRPGAKAHANNCGSAPFYAELGPTFTVDWSFGGPLSDVHLFRATDASGREGFVAREDIDEIGAHTDEQPDGERDTQRRYALAHALGEMPAESWEALIAKAAAEHAEAEEARKMPLLRNLAEITADISAATASLRYMAGEQATDKQCGAHATGQQSAVEDVARMLGCKATIWDVEQEIFNLKAQVPRVCEARSCKRRALTHLIFCAKHRPVPAAKKRAARSAR